MLIYVRRLLSKLPSKTWSTVTGGKPNRKYIPELASPLPPQHKLFELQHEISAVLSPLFDLIQKERPQIHHFRVGALLTISKADSQYDKCSHRLHSDYGVDVYQLEPDARPVSVLIALDDF